MKKLLSTLLTLMYFTTCFLFLFSTTAHAYIDPSTTTYIVQAIAGIAVAVGAFFVMYWRKAKRKIADKLHMDANAGKEVEDEIYTDEDAEQSSDGLTSAEAIPTMKE